MNGYYCKVCGRDTRIMTHNTPAKPCPSCPDYVQDGERTLTLPEAIARARGADSAPVQGRFYA